MKLFTYQRTDHDGKGNPLSKQNIEIEITFRWPLIVGLVCLAGLLWWLL